MDEIEQAIREAVQEAIEELGVDAVKALSWFPSNERN